MKVTAIAGGVGGAKLLIGLKAVAAANLTAVVNTGDDAVVYGVHVSPDLDIVAYWLAGIADTDKGWGIAGDSFTVVETLKGLGVDAWFSLGDRDMATCILRTQMLAAGATLSEATARIAAATGAGVTILPMSDDPVRTRLVLKDGRVLEFQEYFVKQRHQPEVVEVLLDGIETAKPAPGVLESISAADVVVVCPSNPVLSVAPVVALQGVREALRDHPRVVAVSPIVAGKALKGPADRLLEALGHTSSAPGVAELYADFCNLFVIDHRDADEADKIAALGLDVIVTDTIMSSPQRSVALAEELLG